jgi:hypothetical protein
VAGRRSIRTRPMAADDITCWLRPLRFVMGRSLAVTRPNVARVVSEFFEGDVSSHFVVLS